MAGNPAAGTFGGAAPRTSSAKKKPAVPAFQGASLTTQQELADPATTPERRAQLEAMAPPTQTPLTAGQGIAANAQISTQDLRADIGRRQTNAGSQAGGYTSQLDLSGQFGSAPGGAPAPTAAQNVLQQQPGGPPLNPALTNSRLNGVTPPGQPPPGGAPTIRPQPAASKVGQAAGQAGAALGPAPQIDMGLADRGQGAVQDALGLSKQVVDAALTPVDQSQLIAATGDARTVLDKLLNGPSTAERLGSATLRSQMALARSAAGGPGAVQVALRSAQFAAPELQAQATESAVQEELQRNQAAGQITGQLQTSALGGQQNETQRIGTAADAASGFAQGALGSRAQDIQIAGANQDAASKLISEISRLSGTQLELDQRNQELIGQMARDAASMEFQWGSLDAGLQAQEWQRWVEVYGIDKNAAAQLEAIAASQKKHPLDYINSIVGIIGGAATVASAAAGKPA